jgi:uncharacterized cupredoxin-like copper-binding protein
MMVMKKQKVGLFVAVFLSMLLAACGGGSGAPSAPAPKPDSGGGNGGGGNGAVTLQIAQEGESLKFDKDTLSATVAEGEPVLIEYHNSSQTQQHNFTLLNHADLDRASDFNDAASQAVNTGYFPVDNEELMDTVIVHSDTLDPGQRETLEFDAPPAGDYLYICTVPGHFAAGDYGTLTISTP